MFSQKTITYLLVLTTGVRPSVCRRRRRRCPIKKYKTTYFHENNTEDDDYDDDDEENIHSNEAPDEITDTKTSRESQRTLIRVTFHIWFSLMKRKISLLLLFSYKNIYNFHRHKGRTRRRRQTSGPLRQPLISFKDVLLTSTRRSITL